MGPPKTQNKVHMTSSVLGTGDDHCWEGVWSPFMAWGDIRSGDCSTSCQSSGARVETSWGSRDSLILTLIEDSSEE